jgi:hypothetical protein
VRSSSNKVTASNTSRYYKFNYGFRNFGRNRTFLEKKYNTNESDGRGPMLHCDMVLSKEVIGPSRTG